MLLVETDEFFCTVNIQTRTITPVKLLTRAVSLLSKEQNQVIVGWRCSGISSGKLDFTSQT